MPCVQQHQGPPPFVPLRALHRFYDAMSLSSNRLAEVMNPQVSTLSKADYRRDIVTTDDLLADPLCSEHDA